MRSRYLIGLNRRYSWSNIFGGIPFFIFDQPYDRPGRRPSQLSRSPLWYPNALIRQILWPMKRRLGLWHLYSARRLIELEPCWQTTWPGIWTLKNSSSITPMTIELDHPYDHWRTTSSMTSIINCQLYSPKYIFHSNYDRICSINICYMP